MKKKSLDYAAAGVDIAAADRALEKIKVLAKETFNEAVLSDIGAFGGFFEPELKGYRNPVFISSTDSVGTKLKLAFMTDRHDTVGEDLVNHCINDILVHGARPLFFLDYIAVGKLRPETVVEIVRGLSRGCKKNGVALIGGETAELPDFYNPGEYDLAGFIVGIVDRQKIINGNSIVPGDIIIGLSSDGLHTNGYSLARKVVFEMACMKYGDYVESLGMSVGDVLMAVHRCYLGPITRLLNDFEIKGMAHITGGGIKGNLVRILPDNVAAVVDRNSWSVPPIFKFLQEAGAIADDDMFTAFNMGIGYMVVVGEHSAGRIVELLTAYGEKVFVVGRIERGEKAVILKG
jgi:phosphoribosylformylglycinamidine cyclo-ligase